MTAADHNKILAIGFAIFAAIFLFTFWLLLVVTSGVFVGLGFSLASESGDEKQAGIPAARGCEDSQCRMLLLDDQPKEADDEIAKFIKRISLPQ